MDPALKLSALQLESILDRLVPLIAPPDDVAVFRLTLEVHLMDRSSGYVAYFVNKLLKECGHAPRP